jgi:adenylyltransferase/sulfurtransferase
MRCAVMGVFAPLTGIVGTVQAAETLKLLAGVGTTLNGRLLIVDAATMEWRALRLTRDPGCAVCSRHPTEASV